MLIFCSGGFLIIEESGYLQMCWDHHPFWLFAAKEFVTGFDKKKGENSMVISISWLFVASSLTFSNISSRHRRSSLATTLKGVIIRVMSDLMFFFEPTNLHNYLLNSYCSYARFSPFRVFNYALRGLYSY